MKYTRQYIMSITLSSPPATGSTVDLVTVFQMVTDFKSPQKWAVITTAMQCMLHFLNYRKENEIDFAI